MEITERTNTIIGIVIGIILVGSLITVLYMDFNDLGYWSKETPSMTCDVPESERPTPCKPDSREDLKNKVTYHDLLANPNKTYQELQNGK